MSKIKLKPCPFCGSEVYIEDLGVEKGDHYYMIQCTNEDCDAATCFGEKNKKDFIKAWNTRKPVDDVLERLKQLKHEEKLLTAECAPHIFAVSALREAIKIVKEVAADDK